VQVFDIDRVVQSHGVIPERGFPSTAKDGAFSCDRTTRNCTARGSGALGAARLPWSL
jgi:hypothetical protein